MTPISTRTRRLAGAGALVAGILAGTALGTASATAAGGATGSVGSAASALDCLTGSSAHGGARGAEGATAKEPRLHPPNQANANANLSVIDFNLPAAGGNTITPAFNLPVITQPVQLRGTGVVIDTVNTAWGVALNTNGSSIDGLTIHDSSGASAAVGIQVAGNGNSLAGLQIGTDAAGAAFGWNQSTGVLINGNQNVVKSSLIS